MFNTLFHFTFYPALLASDLEDLGLFSRDNLISIRISRVCLLISWKASIARALRSLDVATQLFIYWRRQLLCEEIGFGVIVAKRMGTLVAMTGALVVLNLHWSIVY